MFTFTYSKIQNNDPMNFDHYKHIYYYKNFFNTFFAERCYYFC